MTTSLDLKANYFCSDKEAHTGRKSGLTGVKILTISLCHRVQQLSLYGKEVFFRLFKSVFDRPYSASELNHSHFAYSHFDYSRFAYDLSHFAYSYFAYSRFAYSENFDYSRFAYSSMLIKKYFFFVFVDVFYDYYSHSEIQCHYTKRKPK